MLDDIDSGGDSEPLSLDTSDEDRLREEKREQLATFSEQTLRDELDRMAKEIEEWRDEYEVESPTELQASIDESMSTDERRERWRAAYDWGRTLMLREVVLDVLGRQQA